MREFHTLFRAFFRCATRRVRVRQTSDAPRGARRSCFQLFNELGYRDLVPALRRGADARPCDGGRRAQEETGNRVLAPFFFTLVRRATARKRLVTPRRAVCRAGSRRHRRRASAVATRPRAAQVVFVLSNMFVAIVVDAYAIVHDHVVKTGASAATARARLAARPTARRRAGAQRRSATRCAA